MTTMRSHNEQHTGNALAHKNSLLLTSHRNSHACRNQASIWTHSCLHVHYKSFAPKALVSALVAIWETPGQSLIGDCCILPADFQIHAPEYSRPPLTVLDTQKHTYLQFDWLYHQCCIIATLLIFICFAPALPSPFLHQMADNNMALLAILSKM